VCKVAAKPSIIYWNRSIIRRHYGASSSLSWSPDVHSPSPSHGVCLPPWSKPQGFPQV
jgi:hypothetical protein